MNEKMEYAPMRVVIRAGSEAAKQYTRKAGIDPQALAPGFGPTPAQDLINHGGKIIRDLKFANFYVAGETSWRASDIQKHRPRAERRHVRPEPEQRDRPVLQQSSDHQ